MKGINIENVSKEYKNKTVINNCSLTISEPGVYLIAGPNGAGKTTLLEMIAGLRKQTSGKLEILGEKANSLSAKMNRGFLIQQNTLRKNNYVYEEIDLVLDMFDIKGVDKKNFLREYGLEEYYDFRTKKLSGGTKRRLAIALAFLPKQKIVILDEPVSGLDTNSRDEIWNMIVEYSRDNIVIVADHYLNQAAEYADYAYLLNEGNIVVSNTIDNLRKQILYDTVIKVRSESTDKIYNLLNGSNINYKVLVSGTVSNYYVNTEELNTDIISQMDGSSVLKKIDFEEIYFYHTSKKSSGEE